MNEKYQQLDVPGAKREDVRKLPVLCPSCRKSLLASFIGDIIQVETIHCSLCNFIMRPPVADIVEIAITCPVCGAHLSASRRAITLEIDHIWCQICTNVRRAAHEAFVNAPVTPDPVEP